MRPLAPPSSAKALRRVWFSAFALKPFSFFKRLMASCDSPLGSHRLRFSFSLGTNAAVKRVRSEDIPPSFFSFSQPAMVSPHSGRNRGQRSIFPDQLTTDRLMKSILLPSFLPPRMASLFLLRVNIDVRLSPAAWRFRQRIS